MRILIAGIEQNMDLIQSCKPPHVLFSFYYFNKACIDYIKSQYCNFYIVDSGAFSFFGKKGNIDFDNYVDNYIDFINSNDIERFIELDIDSLVGLDKVEAYRKKMELKTGKQSIPVWHPSRGKDYFIDMVKKYEYVAIGGIAKNEIKEHKYAYIPWFIDTAHAYGCKIHGLGFTDFKYLRKLKFDSVDSTSWIIGSRLGRMYVMQNGKPTQVNVRKDGYRANGKKINEHNLHMFMFYERFL